MGWDGGDCFSWPCVTVFRVLYVCVVRCVYLLVLCVACVVDRDSGYLAGVRGRTEGRFDLAYEGRKVGERVWGQVVRRRDLAVGGSVLSGMCSRWSRYGRNDWLGLDSFFGVGNK